MFVGRLTRHLDEDFLPLENVLPEDVSRRQGHDIVLLNESRG